MQQAREAKDPGRGELGAAAFLVHDPHSEIDFGAVFQSLYVALCSPHASATRRATPTVSRN